MRRLVWVTSPEGRTLASDEAGTVLSRLGFGEPRQELHDEGERLFSVVEMPPAFLEPLLNDGYYDVTDPETGALVWAETVRS